MATNRREDHRSHRGSWLRAAVLGANDGIVSTASLVLGVAARLPRRWFGPVSWSILAAFAHIGGQLVLARVWLVPHDGVWYLVPLFATAALLFGTINGLVAARLLAAPPVLKDAT